MKVFDTGNQFGIGRFLRSIVGASNNKKFIIKGVFREYACALWVNMAVLARANFLKPQNEAHF